MSLEYLRRSLQYTLLAIGPLVLALFIQSYYIQENSLFLFNVYQIASFIRGS